MTHRAVPDPGTARPRWGVTHGKSAVLGGAQTGDPERRLMLAVLLDALHRPSARAWLASEDRSWPFSFASICDALGLESTYLRRRLLRGSRARPRGAGPRRIE